VRHAARQVSHRPCKPLVLGLCPGGERAVSAPVARSPMAAAPARSRWLSWVSIRTGSNPAAALMSPGHGSMTSGAPNKFKTCRPVDVTILDCLIDCEKDQARQRGETHRPGNGAGPGSRKLGEVGPRAYRPSGVANERCHTHPVRDRAGRPARLRTALAHVYRNSLQALELRPRLAPWRASRNRGAVSRPRFFLIFFGGL
jgi:hypothetical protein